MTIEKITQTIVCDTINCNKKSEYKISTYSYKGDLLLCNKCFKNLQSTIKKMREQNEQ